MKNKAKRFLALSLVAMMLAASFPTNAFAAMTNAQGEEVIGAQLTQNTDGINTQSSQPPEAKNSEIEVGTPADAASSLPNSLAAQSAPPAQSVVAVVAGWHEENGSKYYIMPDGSKAMGRQVIENETYYFDPTTGVMQTGFVTVDGIEMYFSISGGKALTGWFTPLDRLWRYADPISYEIAKGKKTIDGVIYLFDDITGAKLEELKLNAFNTDASGNTYYIDANGERAKGRQVIENETYYFDPTTGVMQTSFVTVDGIEMYFSISSGKALKGWFTPIDRIARYADPTTYAIAKGRQVIENETYYFDLSTGAMQTGFVTADGVEMYFSISSGKALKGWFTPIDRVARYADPTTYAIAKGKNTIENEIYYFDPSTGAMQTGFVTADGVDMYFSISSGKALKGWFTPIDRLWRYADPITGEIAKGRKTIDGVNYLFDDITGAKLEELKLNAFNTDALGNTYYIDGNGNKLKGRLELNGNVYFLDPITGIMKTRFYTDASGDKYYFSIYGGKAIKGWFSQEDGNRYYADPVTGKLAKGTTVIDGETYCFDTATCAMRTRFVTDEKGNTYYFSISSGKALKGWFSQEDGNDYYADPTTKIIQKNIWISFADRGPCYFDGMGKYAKPPVIQSVSTAYNSADNTYIITVNATFGALGADNSYSFDGGATWQASAQKAFKASSGGKISAGTIKVRGKLPPNPPAGFNAAVWTASYNKDIIIESPVSKTPYGIDVSMNQGEINWTKVAQSGVGFAIIRASSYNDNFGGRYMDPYFEANVRNAKAAGLKVGAYIFSYADSAQRMTDEVNHFVNSQEMKNLKRDGVKFDLPVYVDYEDKFQLNNTSYAQRTDIVRLGMILLERAGYFPGFYTFHNYMDNFNAAGLVNEGYTFWYARYPLDPQPDKNNPSSTIGANVDIWQYCSDGNVNPAMKPYVNGVNGKLDLNYMYSATLSDRVRAFNGGSAVPPPVTTQTLTVRDINSNTMVTAPRDEILARIVINEVGNSASDELAKAQAVAAHTWILRNYQEGNAAPGVGLKPLAQVPASVMNAVKAVSNKVVMFANQPALTMYGASSGGGWTNSALTYWGDNTKPYLTNVQTPESATEKTNNVYYKRYSATTGMDMGMFLAMQKAGVANPDLNSKANWITDVSLDGKGFVSGLTLHGVRMRADAFYENAWGLMAPRFKTVSYNASVDAWQFAGVSGEGHGLGMSQRGASIYASQGNGYEWILNHYYPGTNLISI